MSYRIGPPTLAGLTAQERGIPLILIKSQSGALKRSGEIALTFSGTFDNKQVTYNYLAPDEKAAKKLGRILEQNIGKTLLSLGTIPMPDD